MGGGKRGISEHILYASSSLMGLCFVLLGFIKGLGRDDLTYVDEISSVGVLTFLIACVFSYISMRSLKNADRYEIIADVVFMTGLALIGGMAVALCFQIIH